MKLYIYGAGKRGRSYADLLKDRDIKYEGFIDRNKELEIDDKVVTYEEFLDKYNSQDTVVLVSMLDTAVRGEILEKLDKDNVKSIELMDIIGTDDNVESLREFVAEYHEKSMQDYFENAELGLDTFWNEDTIFKKLFNRLDTRIVLELACGKGRHVMKYLEQSERIILVDILESNIVYCKNRFRNYGKVECYTNNGYDLEMVEDNSITAVFSYDAVVHFEMIDIFNYLKEIKRILIDGGMALIHHSNNSESYSVSFENGRCGRNYMTKQLFAYLCNRAGLEVVEQHVIDWGGYPELDCLTLVRKKSSMMLR